jgi:hypothetical protein
MRPNKASRWSCLCPSLKFVFGILSFLPWLKRSISPIAMKRPAAEKALKRQRQAAGPRQNGTPNYI